MRDFFVSYFVLVWCTPDCVHLMAQGVGHAFRTLIRIEFVGLRPG